MKFTVLFSIVFASSLSFAQTTDLQETSQESADEISQQRSERRDQSVSSAGRKSEQIASARKKSTDERRSNSEGPGGVPHFMEGTVEGYNKACRLYARNKSSTQNCLSVRNELLAQLPQELRATYDSLSGNMLKKALPHTQLGRAERNLREVEILSYLNEGLVKNCTTRFAAPKIRGAARLKCFSMRRTTGGIQTMEARVSYYFRLSEKDSDRMNTALKRSQLSDDCDGRWGAACETPPFNRIPELKQIQEQQQQNEEAVR